MKKTKIIVPALGLLLLSTAASVTGTVAWFSANTSVSATGMKVQAKAESGLLISADKTDASWSNTDATDYGTAVSLVPTSTNSGSAWYHSQSNSADNYASSGTYKTLTSAADSASNIQVKEENLASTANAVAQVTYQDVDSDDAYTNATDVGYFLMNRFYVKSSGDQIVIDNTANWIAVKTVTLAGISASAPLDASLRIGVDFGGSFKILAPFAAAAGTGSASGTISYTVNGSTATTAYKGTLAADGNYNANLATGFSGNIPAKTTADPTVVNIYLWFEGEDVNCKSNNIVTTLDTLTVSVEFALVQSAPTNIAA